VADIRALVGLPPRDTVRAFEARDELRLSRRWTDLFQEEHASAFTVAKIADLDLLETIRRSLDDVARNGGTFEQWQAAILPELQRRGWWGLVRNPELTGVDYNVIVGPRRLRTIFDTNLRVSRAAGLWQRIQERKDVAPYLAYSAIRDARTRELHARWGGLRRGLPRIILPVDHPWWRTHFPPNGFNCRCTVIQLSRAQLEANGWAPMADPPRQPPPRNYYLPGAARPISVPAGVDPGFAYNPGAASFSAIAEKAARTLSALADRDPAEAIAQAVQLARGATAMRILPTVATAGAESRQSVSGFDRQLSTDEIRHIIRRHGPGGEANDEHPITEADFRLIPLIVATGQRIDQDARGHSEQMFVALIGGLYHVYVERIGRKLRRVLGRTFYKSARPPTGYREEGE
jgi:SPP1 gp7 family putative phage head morphogenesis protein